jgi:ABC-type phosphate/phosphonate transport system substrate-binding protein
MRRSNRFVSSIFLILLAVFLSCQGAVCAAQPPPPEKEQIRIGCSSNSIMNADKKDVYVALNIWGKELLQSTSIKGEPVTTIFDDLKDLVAAVRNKEVDYVAMPILDYLGIRQSVDLEPVLLGTRNGQACEEYVLVVRQQSPWTEVKQLQGKKLLVQATAGVGSISLLWLDNLLIRQGLPVSASFFAPLKMVGKPSQAVLPVFFRQADACLVLRWAYDIMKELNPQIGSETKTLAMSPALLRGGFFMRKGLTGAKLTMIDGALEVGKSTKSKQLMALFNYESFIRFQPQWMQSTLSLYNDSIAFLQKKSGAMVTKSQQSH